MNRCAGLIAGAACFVAGEAVALSCLPPQIETSFNWWVEADEQYYIAVGTLTSIGPLPSIPDVSERLINRAEAPDLSAPYRFEGYLIGERDEPLDTTITVEVGCAGPWCGGFPADGKRSLMPLKVSESRDLSLQIGACPGTLFSASVESVVRDCMAAGRCVEPLLK